MNVFLSCQVRDYRCQLSFLSNHTSWLSPLCCLNHTVASSENSVSPMYTFPPAPAVISILPDSPAWNGNPELNKIFLYSKTYVLIAVLTGTCGWQCQSSSLNNAGRRRRPLREKLSSTAWNTNEINVVLYSELYIYVESYF